MKRTNLLTDDKNDFNFIHAEEHIKKVINELDKNIPDYFEKIYGSSTVEDPMEKLKSLGRVTLSKSEPDMVRDRIQQQFREGNYENYEKERNKYVTLFNKDSMAEFLERNPKLFKDKLRSSCPIIHRCCNSKSDALKDWQEDFAHTKPSDLLDTIENVLQFASKFHSEYPENQYSTFHTIQDYQELKILDDKEYTIKSVIGSGIKSIIAYYMYPSHFSMQVRYSLYGLYFLSSREHFNLPSRDSEFLIIDDRNKNKEMRGSNANFKMDHNYWYPYDLFMYYSKYVYDSIKLLCDRKDITLSPSNRYIDLFSFLNFVCKQHQEVIDTMMSKDESEI